MIVVVLDGAIGAGKSTLLQILGTELGKKYKVVTVPEPVDLWTSTGALADFYRDVKGKAYEFQTFTFATRIQKLQEAWENNPDADIYIIERSPLSDRYMFVEMLHDTGHFTDHQLQKYEIWWNVWIKLWPITPTHFIHIHPGLDACMNRVENRAREGENTIDTNYQQNLIAKHEKFFKTRCPCPHLELNCTSDYRPIGPEREQLLEKIKKFLNL